MKSKVREEITNRNIKLPLINNKTSESFRSETAKTRPSSSKKYGIDDLEKKLFLKIEAAEIKDGKKNAKIKKKIIESCK
jgi:hypothetical protein